MADLRAASQERVLKDKDVGHLGELAHLSDRKKADSHAGGPEGPQGSLSFSRCLGLHPGVVRSWDGLSAGQKAALDKATGKEFSRRAGVAFGREDVEALEKSKNDPTIKYLKISDEERAQFQKSIGSVIEKDLAELESKGINGREVYKALTK